jgi:ABC-type antimicrobial peptide transport system permease subunit
MASSPLCDRDRGDRTIGFLNVLPWVIAAGIIGSIVYLTVIERTRD